MLKPVQNILFGAEIYYQSFLILILIQAGEIILYEMSNGNAAFDVRLEDDTVLLN
jgi:hypothetical protein